MALLFIQKIEGTDGTARVYFDPSFAEYVVKVTEDTDGAQDYFTDDRDEAIQTARAMVQSEGGPLAYCFEGDSVDRATFEVSGRLCFECADDGRPYSLVPSRIGGYLRMRQTLNS